MRPDFKNQKEPGFLLKRLDSIAFRVTEAESVVDFSTKTLGFHIVQEMDPKNLVSIWGEKNGSGLHHMASLFENIGSAAENLRQTGMVFTTDNAVDTGGGLNQLFPTPHPVTGMITEIIERYIENVFFCPEPCSSAYKIYRKV